MKIPTTFITVLWNEYALLSGTVRDNGVEKNQVITTFSLCLWFCLLFYQTSMNDFF